MNRTAKTTAAIAGAVLTASTLAVVTAAPAAAAPAPTSVRVVAGPTPVTDSHGEVWSAATGFTGGSEIAGAPFAVSQPDSTVPAADKALYAHVRQNMTAWKTPVANGRYRVQLLFLDPTSTAAGQRVFGVKSEGATTLAALDIARDVQRDGATSFRFETTVADGMLNVGFVAQQGKAIVSAIRADRVPALPAGTPAKPGPANTGVPAGTSLQVWQAPDATVISLDKPGFVYDGYDFRGRVRINAPNVTIRNSILRGNDSAAPGSVLDLNYAKTVHTGFKLVDSTIAPAFVHADQDGIVGHDFTVVRSEITDTADAVHVTGDNVTIRDSWLHDTHYLHDATGDTHNDGVQLVAGSHLLLQHNTITGNTTSAVQLSQTAAAPSTDIRFVDNWFDDGGCSVNFGGGAGAVTGQVTVTGNLFWRHTKNPDCAVIASATTRHLSDPTSTLWTFTDNRWADDLTPVVVSNGGP